MVALLVIRDFLVFTNNVYGNCYMFNAPQNGTAKISDKLGSSYGEYRAFMKIISIYCLNVVSSMYFNLANIVIIK